MAAQAGTTTHMGRLFADPGFLALISKTSANGHGAADGPVLQKGEAAVTCIEI